jgi:hypothetical protein
LQPILDGCSCSGHDPKIIMENADDVRTSEYHTKFESDLCGIGSVRKFSVVNGGTSFTLEQIAPLLLDTGHLVVNPTGTRTDLGGRSHEKATAREDTTFDIGEESLAQRAEPLAPWLERIQREGDHLDDETVPGSVDRCQLEFLFGRIAVKILPLGGRSSPDNRA